MSSASKRRAVTTWPAEDRRWYLDLVAQADGDFCMGDGVTSVLHRYDSLPWDQCIILKGDGQIRYTDTRDALWSDDQRGRWFETRTKPLRWLHIQIGQLCYGGVRCAKGEVVSHICGNCNCIRADHIVYQSRRADTLDRAHHKRFRPGCIRGEHDPIF